MDDYVDLNTYNRDSEHDMWIDLYNYGHTGTPGVFDEDNLDEYIDTLNWDTSYHQQA